MDYGRHCVSLRKKLILVMWSMWLSWYLQYPYDNMMHRLSIKHAWGLVGTKIPILTQEVPQLMMVGGHTVQLLLCVCLILLLFPRHFLLAILRQQTWRLDGPLIWPGRDPLFHREVFIVQAQSSPQERDTLWTFLLSVALQYLRRQHHNWPCMLVVVFNHL